MGQGCPQHGRLAAAVDVELVEGGKQPLDGPGVCTQVLSAPVRSRAPARARRHIHGGRDGREGAAGRQHP